MIPAERVQQYARETAEDLYQEKRASAHAADIASAEEIVHDHIRQSKKCGGGSMDLTEYEIGQEADLIEVLRVLAEDYDVRPFAAPSGNRYKIWEFKGETIDGAHEWRVDLWVSEK